MRAALVAGALALAGCKPKTNGPPPPTPPTVAEAEAFGNELAKALAPCDGDRLDALVDFDYLLARVVATTGIEVPEDQREVIHAGVLCQRMQKPKQATLLRVRQIDGVPQTIVRLVFESNKFSYLQFELDKRPDGVRVVDIYMYEAGEKLSESMRRIYEALSQGSDVVRKLEGLDRVNRLRASKQNGEALAALRDLPDDFRATKQIMLLELELAHARTDNDDDYPRLVDAYKARFPDDPALDMQQVDALTRRKQWRELLAVIDHLDRRVDDPYLDNLRAAVFVHLGKLPEAIAAARRATAAEPNLAPGWVTLLGTQLDMKAWTDALATLEAMHAKFGIDLDDAKLRADPRYAELVETPEYAAWVKRAAK